ncbi:hypothetical protein ACHAXA_011509 [Cyclostephanos tholiformis]|uniref:Up-regulated during septation protein 1 domain-containing protein n=1 Tax=Cyclostephanos tholiformis TaxID=382380 RepID=A0ABD3SDI1_9STRA
MRMPYGNNGNSQPMRGAMTSSKKDYRQQQQQQENYSGYHSLCVHSQVSTDSEEDCDSSKEGRDDDMNNEGRRTNNDNSDKRDCEEHINPITRLRSHGIVAPTPPPPPPPPHPPSSMPLPSLSSSSSSEMSRHLIERNSGGVISRPTDGNNSRAPQGMPMPPTSSSSSQQKQQQQQNAVLALLNEMRTLELNFQQRSSEYAIERASLMETLSRQSAYISQLESTQQSLLGHNAVLNRRLANTMSRLDKFATGCWQFSSSSVKKMSEALHVQVHEWTRAYGIETSLKASTEEEEAIEKTTMEKMQGMHLEIMGLKRSNRALKKRMLGRGTFGDGRTKEKKEMDNGSGNGNIGQSEQDDEVSHMTGMTQITSTTNMTGVTQTTTPTSATKLLEAMAAFLTTHDGKGGGQHEREGENESQSRPGATTDDVVATVGDVTPKIGSGRLRMKSVQIAPPQSILKSTGKFNNSDRDDAAGGGRARQRPSGHPPPLLQHPGHARQKTTRHKRPNPGLPKSPNMRHNASGGGSEGGSGRRPSSQEVKTAPPPAAASGLDFANFNDDFAGTDENDTWLASWGDDASEV